MDMFNLPSTARRDQIQSTTGWLSEFMGGVDDKHMVAILKRELTISINDCGTLIREREGLEKKLLENDKTMVKLKMEVLKLQHQVDSSRREVNAARKDSFLAFCLGVLALLFAAFGVNLLIQEPPAIVPGSILLFASIILELLAFFVRRGGFKS